MKNDQFPFNLEVDLMTRKDFDKIVSALSDTIFAGLDFTLDTDVCKFLDNNFPYLSDFVKDGICNFFYLAFSRAYDLGGLAACNIIRSHLFEEGEKK